MSEQDVHIDYLRKEMSKSEKRIDAIDDKIDTLTDGLNQHMIDEEKAKSEIRIALLVIGVLSLVGAGMQTLNFILPILGFVL